MNLLARNFFLDDFFDGFERNKIVDMKCDIYEEEKSFVVLIDLPGFSKDEIFVDVSRGYLTIELISKRDDDFDDRNYIRRERIYNTVKRQFYVGNIDETLVKASFNNGVLEIVFPKNDEIVDKKTIEIE